MSDCKERLLRDIETSITNIAGAELARTVSAVVIKCLANYEVTEQCTDLAPVETPNEKILNRYCACLRIDGRSERTVYQYRRTCIKLADFTGKQFTDMGVYDIRYFLACEKDRGISNSTIENARANISSFFQWMTREEIIPKNPIANIKPIKCPDVRRYPFTDTDIDAMRSACKSPKERAIVELLLSSGIRVSELSDMDSMDLDFQKLSVRVRHGKGDKERVTYMTAVAAKYIAEYLTSRKENTSALFCNKWHERLNAGGVRAILKTIEKRAGVTNVHPHRFRRTFASGLAARGMDIQEIKELLGHTNIATTLKYIHVSDEKVRNSYRQYIA